MPRYFAVANPTISADDRSRQDDLPEVRAANRDQVGEERADRQAHAHDRRRRLRFSSDQADDQSRDDALERGARHDRADHRRDLRAAGKERAQPVEHAKDAAQQHREYRFAHLSS